MRGKMKHSKTPVVILILGLAILLATPGLTAPISVIVFQPKAGSAYQLYVPSTGKTITLAGTEKMGNAVIGDVDGNGQEDELLYNDLTTGKLGYYRIAYDGVWHPAYDHAIPNTPMDAVPLAVVREGGAGTTGIIIYNSLGQTYGMYPDGTATTLLGKMDRAYGADVRQLGIKSDIIWYTAGVGMRWREGVTGTDHPDPWGNLIPIGGGAILSGQRTKTIVFFPYGSDVIYVCDRYWNYSRVDGTRWPWCINQGSIAVGDVDRDGFSELVFDKSAQDPLSWYKPPYSGSPWNSARLTTVPSIKCGWNIHGVAQVTPYIAPTLIVTRISNLASVSDGTNAVVIQKARTKLVRELNSDEQPEITGFYIEESDCSAGIRVIGSTTAKEGQLVNVTGTLQTNNGERVVAASQIKDGAQGTIIKPIETTIKSVWSTATMVGLLVSLSGSISAVDPIEGSFTLTDESAQSIKVYCLDPVYPVESAQVTGCVGAEVDSTGNIVPVLRVASAQSDIVINDDDSGTTLADYSYGIRPSLDKVLLTDNLSTVKTASIKAARNEHEEYQIVLKAGQTDLSSVSITAHDLTGPNGSVISASNITVYLPFYINLPTLSKTMPDPLPPCKAPFDMKAGQVQPLWVDVYVPKSATAGDYSGSVTITATNGKTTNVPLSLHIYNFTLSDESKLATQIDFYDYYMAPKEGVTYGSAACKALWKKYYEFLLQRGISTAAPPVDDFFSTEAANYLKDPRLTSFRIPYDPNPASQTKYFNQVKNCGAWGKGFCDVGDEPYTQQDFEKYKTKASYYQSVDPTAQTIVAYYDPAPAWASPQHVTDILAGYVKIWCPIGGNAYESDRLAARRTLGEKSWMYTCTSPDGISPNYFVQDHAASHRVIPWECYLHQASGWLYWHTNYWAAVNDPWTDICTGKQLSTRLYGEGSLIYPGKVHTGTAGPVSSIRLEVFRDGLEDYKYLWILEQKIGRNGVLAYVQKIATKWNSYSKDPALYESIRDQIATKIENTP